MNSTPTISLLIATYNWPAALELCLRSVIQQQVLPAEVVIADDGSGEETRLLIEKYRPLIPVPLQHIWHADDGFRLGMIRNKAMAAAKGDYLIQIDGDLILHPLFVKDHMEAARKGYFIGGSRAMITEEFSNEVLANKQLLFSFFEQGIRNRFNALHIPALARLVEVFKKEKGLFNLRGCNMSFWKKDIIAVNGYNEAISGWGREDTELVIRLYNLGIKRVFFKLQGIVYHLYHKEFDRSRLLKNDEVMELTMQQKLTRCDKGIDQYL
ncbi:glycosyltransferase family 2 protein [Paraflavitalea sp. CAU 1676]|uniref:glycosyltransferase family 2 protein n=1 Tax=Paraflavitalea sp. CAU 1676 TaxID=3032598 RepID=UPI0023DCB2B3|nr:glycosyltransferase family 2 protein [Paraflavitalea sp. CAU 1676]MDF2190803.1 glycosyltransferase family 2 protein [Paraflavitalea sp. CAU 1676]